MSIFVATKVRRRPLPTQAIDTATPPAVSEPMRVTAASAVQVRRLGRSGRLGLAGLLAVVGLSAVARAAPPSLRALYVAGDLAELGRAADAAPIAALTAEAAAADRTTALAAITALPHHPDAPLALPALAAIAGGWDRSVAAPAARAARAIAGALDGDRAIRDDLDDDLLAAAATAWAALAARRDRWSDVRADALGVAAALTLARAATAEPPPDLAALLAPAFADDDPEVRLAALEATPAPAPAALRPAIAARVAADPRPDVQLVAAQALCAGDPAAGLAALDDAGKEALRGAVAPAPARRPGALLDAARCVALDDDPRSVRALAALRHRAPRALRVPLATLARRRAP